MKTESNTRWLITPGLWHLPEKFETLVKASRGRPIMVTGPSGAGKSLFTHIFLKIQENKAKENGIPYDKNKVQTLNVAALKEELLESELFGHEAGAFTGAIRKREGHIKAADEGVLILEEVGELSRYVQSKLLTFIEDGYFYPVGSNKKQHAKVQIICTTNKKLEDKDMRFDFAQRFIQFEVPALHERREDILYLVAFYLPEIINRLRPWEVFCLLNYHWPGNVRELTGRFVTQIRAGLLEDLEDKEWQKVGRDDKFFSSIAFRHFKGAGLGFISFVDQVNSLKPEDKARIHKELSQYHLGLDVMEEAPAFPGLIDYDPEKDSFEVSGGLVKHPDIDERYGVDTVSGIGPFDDVSKAFYSMWFECPGFFNSSINNGPLLKEQPVMDETAFIDKMLSFSFPDIEKLYFEVLHRKTNGNVSEIARRSGVTRKVAQTKLKNFH